MSGRELPVPGGGGLGDGVGEASPAGEPACRLGAQSGFESGVPVREVRAEHLRKQGVQPVPGRSVDAFEEGVGAGEAGQGPVAVAAAGELVRQVGVEPVGDAGPQQQLLRRGRLRGEHLREQVVGDRGAVGGERADERLRVGAALHRQRGQAQPGRPAVGTFDQPRDTRLCDLQTVRAQQQAGVGGGEHQIGVADLGDLAARPIAVQRQQRVGTGGQHEAQPTGGVPDDEVHTGGDLGRGHRVELVEHHDHRLLGCGQRVGEAHQQRVVGPLGPRRPPDLDRQPHPAPIQRFEQIGPEQSRGVAGFHGQPDRRQGRGAVAGPLGGEDRLAGAGRSGEQGHRPAHPVGQPIEQPRAADEDLRRRRDREPGREQRITRRCRAAGVRRVEGTGTLTVGVFGNGVWIGHSRVLHEAPASVRGDSG